MCVCRHIGLLLSIVGASRKVLKINLGTRRAVANQNPVANYELRPGGPTATRIPYFSGTIVRS